MANTMSHPLLVSAPPALKWCRCRTWREKSKPKKTRDTRYDTKKVEKQKPVKFICINWIGLHDWTISFYVCFVFFESNVRKWRVECHLDYLGKSKLQASTLFAKIISERCNIKGAMCVGPECPVSVLRSHCDFCRFVIRSIVLSIHCLAAIQMQMKWKIIIFQNCPLSQLLPASTAYNKRKMYAQVINASPFEYEYRRPTNHRSFLLFCRDVQMQSSYKLHFASSLSAYGVRPCMSLFVWTIYKSNHTSDFIVAGFARKTERRKSEANKKNGNTTIKRNRILQSTWCFRVREMTKKFTFFQQQKSDGMRFPTRWYRIAVVPP